MKILSGALILLFAGCIAYCHEQPTHQNISLQSVRYLNDTDALRKLIFEQNAPLPALLVGAWNEDDTFKGSLPLGRYYFHFLPPLNDLGQTATCSSAAWGFAGVDCKATTNIPFVNPVTATNDHGWGNAIAAADPVTGSPTPDSWKELGYVLHLLEDLTSPPHARNSAHPCIIRPLGVPFCDPFEIRNDGITVNSPRIAYIDFSGVSAPEDFFNLVQAYTHANYFSARTIFNGDGGPSATFEHKDPNNRSYFYGACLQTSIDFGQCENFGSGMIGRKIAHKGLKYYLTLDRRRADIDSVIAHEQFQELAPVATEAVAAFIQYYAPVISVSIDPSSTGTGIITSSPGTIDCGATCSASFVREATALKNGTQVELTATPDKGSAFSGWSGDCTGTDNPIAVDVTTDKKCAATFNQPVGVDLNPFGSHNLSDTPGPYNIQVVNGALNVVPAPADITMVVHWEVHACGLTLFPQDIPVTIPKGQQTVGAPRFVAGRPLGCGSATTVWTILSASMGGTPLDLSFVPPARLSLAITR